MEQQPLLSHSSADEVDPETGFMEPHENEQPTSKAHACIQTAMSSSHAEVSSAAAQAAPGPRSRWRKAVGAMGMVTNGGGQAKTPRRLGKPQGIDVKRTEPHHWDYLHHDLNTPVRITVVDYDAEQVKVHQPLSNADLPTFLAQPRPEWATVRWINLQGLSWDCILALALRFELHPLTVEDCVQIPQRIKVDFHSTNSIFCSLTLASVVLERGTASGLSKVKLGGRGAAPCVPDGSGACHATRDRGRREDHSSFAACEGQQDPEAACGRGGEGGAPAALRRLSSARVKGTMVPLHTKACQPPSCADLAEVLSGMSQISASSHSYRPLRKRPSQPGILGAMGGNSGSSGILGGGGSTMGLGAGGAALSVGRGPGTQASGSAPGQSAGSKGAAGSGAEGEAADAAMLTSLEIGAEQVYIFLLQDGTVISMFEKDGGTVCRPVLQQLVDPGSLARDSEDPSYLLNLLVDAIVDVAFPLVDAYMERLQLYEDRVLLGEHDPVFTRDLHVMRGDLAALRRTMMPTSSMVAALQGHGGDHGEQLISRLTQTYLGDVQDHLGTILDDMEGLQNQCQALSDLVFNLTAHDQNKSMQTLSVISAIFLPITFIAGVYGANFEFMPELHWEWGYLYFWCLCCSLAVVFMLTLFRLRVMA